MLFSSAYSSSSSLPRLLWGPLSTFLQRNMAEVFLSPLLPVLCPSFQAPKHDNQRKAIGCTQLDIQGRMARVVNNGGLLLF